MSMIERVCETCVYCTFSGNCDRYGRPLTDIEMPACSGYEVHPLLTENAKLRELVRDLYRCDDESCTHCKHWNQGDGFYCNLGVGWKARRMSELGVEVADD